MAEVMQAKHVSRFIGAALGLGVVALFIGSMGERAPRAADAVSQPQGPASGGRPLADATLRSLLDGLREGDELAGWTVIGIFAPKSQTTLIELEKDGTIFGVGLEAKRPVAQQPPVSTDLYNLGYGHHRAGPPPDGTQMQQVAEAVAERIRKREHQVGRPAGL